MSTVSHSPLGGFEERLLTQLKLQVADQPTPATQPNRTAEVAGRFKYRPRTGSLLTAFAAATAMIIAVLNVLPGAGPTLAQAFPILNSRAQALPANLDRMLRSQRLTTGESRPDPKRAYTFQTPLGTGYVVVDAHSKWLCILVPSAGPGNTRCETATRLLGRDSAGVQFATKTQSREDIIVGLVPAGGAATIISTHSGSQPVAIRDGILTVVTHHPVTITTTVNGRQTSRSYDPA